MKIILLMSVIMFNGGPSGSTTVALGSAEFDSPAACSDAGEAWKRSILSLDRTSRPAFTCVKKDGGY